MAATPDAALVRVKLAPQIIERLRDEIMSGVWAPGASLPANVLSARYGVSHIPVREALLVLESEGFLSLAPNRMAIVCEPTVNETAEKLVLLQDLEGLAAQLATTHASDEDIAGLESMQVELERLFAARELAQYHRLNQAFHRRVVELSGNASLAEFHQSLTRHLEWARVRSGIRAGFLVDAPSQHGEIIALLRKRDAVGARRVAETHFAVVSVSILSGLQKPNG
jgi:DNA-binding GntR family transcriptional regulator